MICFPKKARFYRNRKGSGIPRARERITTTKQGLVRDVRTNADTKINFPQKQAKSNHDGGKRKDENNGNSF